MRAFLAWLFWILVAGIILLAVLCFGGLIFPSAKPKLGTTQ